MIMKRVLIMMALLFAGLISHYFLNNGSDHTFTLYRNSGINEGESIRLHVATFDSLDTTYNEPNKDHYNKTNCELAASMFQQKQQGGHRKFWCEKGRFKE